jgi:hypothetical protein
LEIWLRPLIEQLDARASGTPTERWIASDSFWKRIDTYGEEFVGLPYLDREPAYLARSTAKNMPLTTARRKLNTRDPI